ncbi:MAG: M20/M25/M40 family metallo-hydrolase [Oscillospiraceae bacterium]|nr:M20/M25/M40 family metallo-hydrolase [Oscillospiraceae bacterium]
MDILSIINKLSEHPSPSGFEHSASKWLETYMSRFFEKTDTDSFGNVYGIRKCGKKNAKCLLLDAHIDEIGLIVTGEKVGFLTFATLGGVDPRILPACEVTVLSNPPRDGVITVSPPHLLTAKDMENAVSIEDLFIDVGAEGKSGIEVGTPVVFTSSPVKLRENYVSARALDDRASLASILRAIDMLKGKKLNFDIVAVASAQEELGCRGARVAGYSVDPDWAIVVDVTHGTTPGADKSSTFDCGSGVAIGVGPNMTKKMSDALIAVAKDKKIAHSIEVCAGHSGTNAWTVQTVREGIATGLLSIPLKYMHTPVETVKKNDVEAVAKLIYEFVLWLSSGGAVL